MNRHLVLAIGLVLAAPATSFAQGRPAARGAPGTVSVHPDSSRNFGLKQLLIGAAGLAAVAALIDPPIARDLQTGTSTNTLNIDRQLDRFGDATGTIPILGGIALTGVIARDHALLRVALHATESVVLADLLTQTGKYVVGRTRPGGDPDLDGFDFHSFGSMSPSFPSGHAANAFALATSLGDAANKTWLRVVLYGAATATAWARLSEQQHWLSDVIGGAAVGYGSAKFVSGKLRIFGVRAPRLLVGPHTVAIHASF